MSTVSEEVHRQPAGAARNPSLHLRESERDLTVPNLFAHLQPAEYQRLRDASSVLHFRQGRMYSARVTLTMACSSSCRAR